jgi:hypothetical protein
MMKKMKDAKFHSVIELIRHVYMQLKVPKII